MRSESLNKIILFILLVLPILGIADSGYLTFEHFSGGTPVCIVGQGCDVVTTSQYSKILGIPVALMGLVYYLVFFALSLALSFKLDSKTLFALRILLSAGLVFSLWFVYAQIFLIGALCFYCMVSASISALSFILAWSLRIEK